MYHLLPDFMFQWNLWMSIKPMLNGKNTLHRLSDIILQNNSFTFSPAVFYIAGEID